jgi:hypothetical protein
VVIRACNVDENSPACIPNFIEMGDNCPFYSMQLTFRDNNGGQRLSREQLVNSGFALFELSMFL